MMSSSSTALVLRLMEARNRERALAFERARKVQTRVSAAAAHEDALRRLGHDPAITIGKMRRSGEMIRVAEEIALMHAIILGSTGSGKTRFIIHFLLEQLARAMRARGPGERELGFETEVLDPKGETASLLRLYIAALWLAADEETRSVLAASIYTIDGTREYVTPSAPYDNRDQIVSDAYRAHLLADVTLQASRQTYSEPLKQLLFLWSWLLIDLRFPANFAFAERFFRDEPFRRGILEKVGSAEVRQNFAAVETVVARQTKEAFLRRIHADLSFPENRYAIGVPPENLDGLLRPEDAQLVIGNFGCSNVLPQSLGLSRATWRAIAVLLDAPRRRRKAQKTIVFEELALLLSSSTEMPEILNTSLRILRSARIGLIAASQDLAGSLPKAAVRNIILNTFWSATFQSRAEEAELVYPHVVVDSADLRSAAERHRAFLRDVETMPRQEFWLTVKGGYPALPARSLDLPDPSVFAGTHSDEELAEVYDREIGRRSMLTTKQAAEYIAAWEARVVGRQEIASTPNKPHHRTAHNLADLLEQIGGTSDKDEEAGDDGDE
jgi:hypothetical protein